MEAADVQGSRSRSQSLQSTGRVRLNLAAKDSAATPKESDVRSGPLGRGFNVLDGSTRTHLFTDINAEYIPGNQTVAFDKMNLFKDYLEYEKELKNRIGIAQWEPGMFSLYFAELQRLKLLAPIQRTKNSQYLHYEVLHEDYTLKLTQMTNGIPEAMRDDEDVKFIMANSFTKETKFRYYAVIDRYGTHFVSKVTLGGKAELRWSFEVNASSHGFPFLSNSKPEKPKDALSVITKTQRIKDSFLQAVEEWKENKFTISSKRKTKVPKSVDELGWMTKSFQMQPEERMKQAELIGIKVTELSAVFPHKTKSNMEVAIKAYLEEMRPRRVADDLKDGQVVGLYCPEKHSFLGVDDHGHLSVSSSTKIHDTLNKFEVKKKGHRIGLKSLLYSHKLVSRAMTKSVFHFHRLQYMGPHESFEVDGDYVFACGNLHSSVPLYIAADNRVHHDGKGMNKMFFLDVSSRDPTHDEEHHEVKEPIYMEDRDVEIKFAPYTAPVGKLSKEMTDLSMSSFDKPGAEHFHKSNSTSSLYIKDTISLPNVDELTKRMALYLHAEIVKGHQEVNPKFIDLVDEGVHPLTRHASLHSEPTVETIYHFLNTIFKVEKLNPEPGIMSLIYLSRMRDKTGVTLHARTWRRAILSSLILSSKVWEDLAVWNVDFLELFPNITVKDLNRMERFLLESIEFNVAIKASVYVKMFFDLMEHASLDRGPDEKPMDRTALEKLEIHTASSEKEYFSSMLLKKSVSYADVRKVSKTPKSPGGLGILS